MKKILPLALALAFCLAGCGLRSGAMPTATPVPTPSSTPTEEVTPTPTEEPTELWGFPIDDTHDAFEVDTKGRLGTVLVTSETRRIEEQEPEFLPCQATICVWDRSDLTTPIQTIEADVAVFDPWLIDANFDDHPDIDCVWFRASPNLCHFLLIWDEELGQFVQKGDFNGCGLVIEEETQTLYENTHGSAVGGIHSIYRWEGKELVCARTIEVSVDGWDLVVHDRVDGELKEVYRKTFGPPDYDLEDKNPIYQEAPNWYDLSYHG